MADLYEFRLQGHLDEHWTEWFEGLAVTHAGDGTTMLERPRVRPGSLASACWSGCATWACRCWQSKRSS